MATVYLGKETNMPMMQTMEMTYIMKDDDGHQEEPYPTVPNSFTCSYGRTEVKEE